VLQQHNLDFHGEVSYNAHRTEEVDSNTVARRKTMGYGKKSGKGMQGGGKSSPSGESYPAGDLSAKPA